MRILFPLLIILLAWSCAPPIVFNEPQPADTESRSRFEFHYQGNFFCSSDSSLVIIKSDCVYKEKILTFAAPKTELESSGLIHYEGEELYYQGYELPIEVLFEDDVMLAGNLIMRDTLFLVGEEHVLKYFKGYQILNIKMPEGDWDIWLLGQDGFGNLSLSHTILPENLDELEAITPVKDLSTPDKTQYKISPSKVEFRKLLSKKLIFEECDYFERIGREVIYN